MNVSVAIAAAAVALGPVATPAHAGAAQGLSCGLAAGVVTGGPAVLTGELAVTVEYWCTIRVVAPGGARPGASARFAMPGPVAYLPPTSVSFTVDPATDRVEVCTAIEWYFGFPGGGLIDLGCRPAAHTAALGWVAVPEPLV